MRNLIALLSLCAAAGTASSAPVLIVDAGILQGAQGISVNGSLYDVAFRDGSCIELFSGCDSPTDFTFTSPTDALAAAQALLDQVFNDGPLGAFDSSPGLIRGCETGFRDRVCTVFTPVNSQVYSALSDNYAIDSLDGVRAAGTLRGEDLTRFGTVVYGVWTQVQSTPPPPVSSVGEPSSLALGLAAGMCLFGLRFRRRVLGSDA